MKKAGRRQGTAWSAMCYYASEGHRVVVGRSIRRSTVEWRNFVEGGRGILEKRAVQGGGGDQGPVLCRGH